MIVINNPPLPKHEPVPHHQQMAHPQQNIRCRQGLSSRDEICRLAAHRGPCRTAPRREMERNSSRVTGREYRGTDTGFGGGV